MQGLPLTPGNCSGCEIPIWEKDLQTLKLLRPLSNYREFFFCTNNERMNRHAICASCITTLTDKKVKEIFERIRETWRLQMVGSANIQDFIRLDKQEVACWDLDEKVCEGKYYGK